MDTIIRENLSINVKTIDLLNEQIKKEAQASASYLAMASWCDQNGFMHCAKLFFDQSNEEREHMLKIFNFILENGGIAYSPQIQNINHEYSSITDIFKTALQQEIEVSKSIHNIFLSCRKENDIPAEIFLTWFIKEQQEEEQKMRRAIQIYQLHGNDVENIYALDKRMAGV